MKRLLILALWLPVAVWAANTNSFHNLSTSNLISTGAITLNGGALTVSNNTLKLNGAAVTSGTYDHSALSNVLWTASGHTGTVGRIAGFLEGGAAGFVGIGSGLELDGSDNLNVTNSPMAAFAVSSGVASNSLKWNTVALQGNTGIGTENYLLRSLGVATPQAEFVDPSTVSVGTATYSAGSGYATSSGYSTNAGAVGGVALGGLVQTNDTRYLATLTNGATQAVTLNGNLVISGAGGGNLSGYVGTLSFASGGYTNTLSGDAGGLAIGLTGQSAVFRLLPFGNHIYFQNKTAGGGIYFTGNAGAATTGEVTFLTGKINANGSGITNVNAATLGGVAVGGLVQTNRQIIAGANITVNGGASAPLTGDVTIASTGGGGSVSVIPIALLPGAALSFGSTNNATIVGTSNADVGATSNNWDELEFDWLTAQSATWQVMNHNTNGLTNVAFFIRSPSTGNFTNVFSFGYIAGTNGGLRPPTWTASITWTQAVGTVTNEIQTLTGTIVSPTATGPVWFTIRRDATSAADTLATNSYVIGGRLW